MQLKFKISQRSMAYILIARKKKNRLVTILINVTKYIRC